MIFRLIYTLIGYLFLPLVIVFLNLPKKHKQPYGLRFFELLGFIRYKSNNHNRVWIHTVSVGETIAAIPFIKQYHEKHPDIELIVTTTTTTGAQQLNKLDFMETELWPNWLNACQKRNIPTILMNARLSERSCQKYQKLFSVFTQLIGSKLSLVLCQNKNDEERFRRLKVTNTQITGSMKYDLEINTELCIRGNELKKIIGDRPIWIAASTHEGEDEIFLAIHKNILSNIPNALLILVPRHPQRFDSVAQKVIKQNFTIARRSMDDIPNADTNVYLGDTLGELILLYQAADVVFIGGSLTDIGGHNPIEPASVSKPLLIGPYYYNFEDIVLKLSEAGGLEIIEDQNLITSRITNLLLNKETAKHIGIKAFDFVEANHGAITKTINHIDDIFHSLEQK